MRQCPSCDAPLSEPSWRCPSCSHDPPVEEGFVLLAPALAHGGGGFDPQAFAALAAAEQGSFWFRTRNRLILWTLKRHRPTMERYLEIGCGTGFVLSAVCASFPGLEATGSEVFVAGLPHARRRLPGVELLQMDAQRVPYNAEFDAVGAFDVLEHIDDDDRVLREVHRSLKPGGALVVTVPQHPRLWSAQDDYAHHVRRYRIGELASKMRAAGFQIELDTSFVSLLLPAMWLSRRGRDGAADHDKGRSDLAAEMKLPATIDRALESVMDIEAWAIRRGIRFPVGGSRLIVAGKSRE